MDHALSLGDLSEVDWLELKGALPFAAKSDRKRSAVVLARAVLGLANRAPDVASQHLGGFGVVLVGIEGHVIAEAERVDGAVLHDALQPYVGDDGPRWDYVFIDHPNGLVMALVVDNPRWGDRIHAIRKDYSADGGDLTVRDGEVFVRVPGKTRPATSHDIAELQRRRDKSPSRGAKVSVDYDDAFDRIDLNSLERLFEGAVEKAADRLLAGSSTREQDPFKGSLASLRDPLMASWSPDEYRHAVDEWRAESLAMCKSVAVEYLRHEQARGRLRVLNESDRYLEAVRVQAQFPQGVVVLMASDTDYCDHGGAFDPFALLPDRPTARGGSLRFAMPTSRPLTPRDTLSGEFGVVQTPHGAIVTWHVGDLRPRTREVGNELLAVVTDDHVDSLTVKWSVTARGVDHVFEGEVSLTCAQESGQHLAWGHASDGQEQVHDEH